jgi:hypothetical protein
MRSSCSRVALQPAAGLLVALVLAGIVGCRSTTAGMDPDAIRWSTYTNPTVGYSLSYPAAFSVDSRGGGDYVGFRYGASEPAIVRFVSEAEGRRAGLWFGVAPTRETSLGSAAAEEYVYHHYDGPFGVRMLAVAISWRGRYLALELRTDDEPTAVQRRMLESFVLSR